MYHTIKKNIMAQITNIRNLQVNDIITLTHKCGKKRNLIVTRVESKSWYHNQSSGRHSYGTLESFFNNAGDIVKCEIQKYK